MTAEFTSIVADSRLGGQKWDRMIFGHFIEHFHTQIYGGLYEPGSPLSDDRGFRMDVIEAMRELKTPIMRWPGGNYVSDHHWYEAVGRDRIASYNKAWRVPEPNTFGTDEFIAWCKEVGCEPYICTNGGNGTAEEMSNWVEYCNGRYDTRYAMQRQQNGNQKPFGVKYWGIGNESYGDWQIGAKTVSEWGPYVAESAKMMRAVDEDIILSAAAVPDTEWTLALLRAAGRYLDLVSIHGYWDRLSQVENPSDYMTAIMQSENPGQMITQTRNVIGAAGFTGKVKIAFDEWNLRGWHHPDGTGDDKINARDLNDIPQTYTMADALFSASFLNACLRNGDVVTMANMAPSVNTRGPLYAHKNGVVKRTTFHTMKMYVDQVRELMIDARVDGPQLTHGGKSVARVDAIVSKDNAGTTVTLVNRDPSAAAGCRIVLDGQALQGEFTADILEGDSPDAFNSVEAPNAVVPRQAVLADQDGIYSIPPHALCMLHIPA
ncbi:Intracellular exo-alpha-(1-_5)-L-arabinofuranosidase [Devosia sp. LC5]|uniref:alpha-L-arabinofuranosidase C-terminal domain-containing protein n=1 Tax=Devosia sp. LC5 TaxID=1502724 RepID=UPI0004E46E98|nr:alpha-L-arabinofuranosidase C-terminal domain-containing protein [Devosia sp. LC5]KFC70627.1 Intracellular exo-alpha-(1->5)-L-arabinofuranosidase [Devosia sp. LC5]